MIKEMRQQPKFWMVYGLDQGAPTMRHWNKADAQREARRLANTHPGIRFIVLAAVDGYVADEPIADRVSIVKDELPF